MATAEIMKPELEEAVKSAFFGYVEEKFAPLLEGNKKELKKILESRGISGVGGAVESLRNGYIVDDRIQYISGLRGRTRYFIRQGEETEELPEVVGSLLGLIQIKDNFALRVYHAIVNGKTITDFTAKEGLNELPEYERKVYQLLEQDYASLKANLSRIPKPREMREIPVFEKRPEGEYQTVLYLEK